MAQAVAAAAAGGRGLEPVQATQDLRDLDRRAHRLGSLALALLAACRAGAGRAGRRCLGSGSDLWSTKPSSRRRRRRAGGCAASTQTISFLGAAEVRDMSAGPASAARRLPRAHGRAGPGAGADRGLAPALAGARSARSPTSPSCRSATEAGCACTYRVPCRAAPRRRTRALRAGALAPAGDADGADRAGGGRGGSLAPWAGRTVDLLLEVRPLGPLPPPRPTLRRGPLGEPRGLRPRRCRRRRAPGAPRQIPTGPNVLLVGLDTLRADALGAWGRTPSLTPALDRAGRPRATSGSTPSPPSTSPTRASPRS